MTSDLLEEALQALDAPQGRYAELERYARGEQRLAWISPESRKALGDRLPRLSSNIPALQVNSIVERLRIVGYSDPRAFDLFTQTDLDQLAAQAMADALLYSCGWVLVWSKDGRPVATVESPRQCQVLRDPADRSVVAGVKRYSTKNSTEAYLYLPNEILHYSAPMPDAAIAGFGLVERIENPLNAVPLVPINNGHSEIRDLLPLVDALNHLLVSMMVGAEAAGKGRRWISGLQLVERNRVDANGDPVLGDDGQPVVDLVSPINDIDVVQTMISENPETKFGALPSADLSAFEDGVRVIISQISAISSLPGHYLNPLSSSQVPSADGLRASEASLTARCEQKQQLFGRAWETVGRLLIAIDNPGTDPASLPLRVKWGSAATRSIAQEMDAATKAFSSRLLSRRTILAGLGMSDDEVEQELANIRAEANDARDITLGRIVSGADNY
ncbi:phage portal protein [Mycobacterium marseillense]|uniref:phage portal protein n=1 Tax=Mycobacterium marseillense TaxID=701042 RepID=UPI0011A208CC|nr:phage portal protein [Mycobacterium marseillense]